jgi:hypothetical protein
MGFREKKKPILPHFNGPSLGFAEDYTIQYRSFRDIFFPHPESSPNNRISPNLLDLSPFYVIPAAFYNIQAPDYDDWRLKLTRYIMKHSCDIPKQSI